MGIRSPRSCLHSRRREFASPSPSSSRDATDSFLFLSLQTVDWPHRLPSILSPLPRQLPPYSHLSSWEVSRSREVELTWTLQGCSLDGGMTRWNSSLVNLQGDLHRSFLFLDLWLTASASIPQLDIPPLSALVVARFNNAGGMLKGGR